MRMDVGLLLTTYVNNASAIRMCSRKRQPILCSIERTIFSGVVSLLLIRLMFHDRRSFVSRSFDFAFILATVAVCIVGRVLAPLLKRSLDTDFTYSGS